MNLGDFQLALKFHTFANRPISPTEFQRAVKISSGFELDPLIVEVIFKVFDQDNDGHLSYKEFIAVLKDRISRGLKVCQLIIFVILEINFNIMNFLLRIKAGISISLATMRMEVYFKTPIWTAKAILSSSETKAKRSGRNSKGALEKRWANETTIRRL